MKSKKIVIEVIWRPTESVQSASMLADDLTETVEKALRDRGIAGAAFALQVEACRG